jgi:hypothetical protein
MPHVSRQRVRHQLCILSHGTRRLDLALTGSRGIRTTYASAPHRPTGCEDGRKLRRVRSGCGSAGHVEAVVCATQRMMVMARGIERTIEVMRVRGRSTKPSRDLLRRAVTRSRGTAQSAAVYGGFSPVISRTVWYTGWPSTSQGSTRIRRSKTGEV